MTRTGFRPHRPGGAKVYYLNNQTGELDPIELQMPAIIRSKEEYDYLRKMVIEARLPLPVRVDFISTHLHETFPPEH